MRYITVGTKKGESPDDLWRYKDLPVDKKGWTRDKSYRPHPFDICLIILEGKPHPINGWWTGYEWYSLRIRRGDKIAGWKLNKEFY